LREDSFNVAFFDVFFRAFSAWLLLQSTDPLALVLLADISPLLSFDTPFAIPNAKS